MPCCPAGPRAAVGRGPRAVPVRRPVRRIGGGGAGPRSLRGGRRRTQHAGYLQARAAGFRGLAALGAFLGTAPDKESDLEGAAAIGSRIDWISSHGRNKGGKLREERHRFFATEVDTRTVPPSLRPIGSPYTRLLDDLLSADALKRYRLKDAAQRAPEAAGGFNIEGLAATADGKLLIGLRNPLVAGRALLVPLENPEAVVNGEAARIGTPILLDLGGRGVRSIECVASAFHCPERRRDDRAPAPPALRPWCPLRRGIEGRNRRTGSSPGPEGRQRLLSLRGCTRLRRSTSALASPRIRQLRQQHRRTLQQRCAPLPRR